MEMADKFGLPVITLIDTAGAYPGIGAEERGQAEAIARSTDNVPRGRRADHHGRHRRGRIGRRDRHRDRQTASYMLEHCDLHRGVAGSGGLDPVARFRQAPSTRPRT
jgi:hypothetical protein